MYNVAAVQMYSCDMFMQKGSIWYGIPVSKFLFQGLELRLRPKLTVVILFEFGTSGSVTVELQRFDFLMPDFGTT